MKQGEKVSKNLVSFGGEWPWVSVSESERKLRKILGLSPKRGSSALKGSFKGETENFWCSFLGVAVGLGEQEGRGKILIKPSFDQGNF